MFRIVQDIKRNGSSGTTKIVYLKRHEGQLFVTSE